MRMICHPEDSLKETGIPPDNLSRKEWWIMPVNIDRKNRLFFLSGGGISYVMKIDEERRLLNLHWGHALPFSALPYDPAQDGPAASFDLPVSSLPLEIPVCGTGWYGTPAVSVENSQGDNITDLRVTGWRIRDGKASLSGLPATYTESPSEAQSLEIDLEDALTGLHVTALYSVFHDTGAVTRSLILQNRGSAPLKITQLLSASVPLWESGLEVLHLKGAWARERTVVRTPAGMGEYRIFSQRGASGHEENPFMALCDPSADEFSGRVWGVSLVYSGSFLALSSSDVRSHSRLSIGLNPDVFSWKLDPGEVFTSPEAVMVFSSNGFNGLSQVYHRLYRTRLARGYWRDRTRPVLINNWEGTYFNFNEEKLLSIAQKARDIGVELFVLDDGWFGRRNSDTCSLGDWVENREKLPGGLRHLAEQINGMGLRFGLWFEPEMVSPDSDLYRNHPDWCLHVDGRERTQARNQLILDLCRREVQDEIIRAVSAVLSSAPISYVKWDMNRNMSEAFSSELPAERKLETQHRYMLGLYRVLETITSRFPDVLFESCSGGGGRFDPGMLYYMPQTWTSDDTDAAERLKIQYGTSLVYPVSAMGAHVSAVPNHQTGRILSLRTRGLVALSGNFGFELDLTKMSDEELAECSELIRLVKRYRKLTQSGTFWRLLSPFRGEFTAWSFVSESGDEALLFACKALSVPNTSPVRIRLCGLSESAYYQLDDGRCLQGGMLMHYGLTISLNGDFSACLIHMKRCAAPANP